MRPLARFGLAVLLMLATVAAVVLPVRSEPLAHAYDEVRNVVGLYESTRLPIGAEVHGSGDGGVVKLAGGQPRASLALWGELSAPNTPGAAGLWSRTEFKGTRVYQRNDLIDPTVADRLGRTNVQRMQQGLAPLGPDGNPLNLHHMIQRADGPVAELTQSFHQANSRVIHINPNTVPSGIDRSAFGSWRQSYWRSRACDFGGC